MRFQLEAVDGVGHWIVEEKPDSSGSAHSCATRVPPASAIWQALGDLW
jgi:hypothetical protein